MMIMKFNFNENVAHNTLLKSERGLDRTKHNPGETNETLNILLMQKATKYLEHSILNFT